MSSDQPIFLSSYQLRKVQVWLHNVDMPVEKQNQRSVVFRIGEPYGEMLAQCVDWSETVYEEKSILDIELM